MIKNRTLFTGDNLPILRGMEDCSVDLIYLDPPFNSNANYAAPIGSDAAGAEFKDTWGLSEIDVAWYGELADKHQGLYDLLTAVKCINGKSMMAYLIYMAVRIMELHRVLKNTGSLYLHCDPTASHYLKLLLDELFGAKNFRNEIVWHYNKWTNASQYFQRNHDIVLWYVKSRNYKFNKLYGDPTKRQLQLRTAGYNTGSSSGRKIVRIYDRTKPKVIEKLKSGEWDDRDIYDVDVPLGSPIPDVWLLPVINGQAKERTGFPTQKPLALLSRIIEAGSNKGDMVLDPFCGCATACVASEILERKWIGIDIEKKAIELVKMRLHKEVGYGSGDNLSTLVEEVIHRTDIPNDRKGKLSKDIKHLLYGKQDGKCIYCMVRFPFRNLTIDHIVAKSKGGTDTDDNIQLLCNSCNSQKGDMVHEKYLVYRKKHGFDK